MKDLFGRDKGKEMEILTKKVFDYMAWHMVPISNTHIEFIAVKLGLTDKKELKIFLNTLRSNTKMIIPSSIKDKMELQPMAHLELLWNMRSGYDSVVHLYANLLTERYYVDKILLEKWRTSLLDYASKGSASFPDKFDEYGSVLHLCRMMPYSLEWNDLFSKLPDIVLDTLWNYEKEHWCNDLLKANEELIRGAYLNDVRMNAERRDRNKEIFSFYEYVLSGRINEIPQAVSRNDWMGLCAHALWHQYHGQHQEAVKLYQQALKLVKTLFFYHPFYDMTYALALINDTEASSKKKITVLFKKKELREVDELLPVRLLFNMAMHIDMTNWSDKFLSICGGLAQLPKVLSVLILKHYHLVEDKMIDFDSFVDPLSHDHLKLLQLEFSQDFSAFQCKAEQLKKELEIVPLLPVYRRLSEWEKVISLLMDATNSKETTTAPSPESQSRIIYHIDQRQQITPRLQKTKDGISWSKGRNIALLTFKQQKVAEMNEIDLRLSACVQCYQGGWGVGEYYELEGASALSVLAGYPLVFQDENPEVPVVIVKTEPQIVVTKEKAGYLVSTNVPLFSEDRIVVSKENDQLYRVIELTTLQRKIVEALNRTSRFPEAAKKELSELLGRLSKTITVHSDLLQNDESLKTIKGDALITVQLQPMGEGIKVELFVKPFVGQSPYCKAGEGAGSVIGVVNGKRVQAVRNIKKEKSNFQSISRLLQAVSGDKTATDMLYFDDYYQCLDLIEALREQTDISRTEWPEGAKFSVPHTVDFSHLSLSLKGAGQWFEVEGELNIDAKTQLKISELLQKVRQSKGRFIALNDSEFLALSKQLRRQLEEMDAMLLQGKKKMQISSLNASSLVAMEQMGVSLKKDKAFVGLQQRIEEADKAKFTLPKNLQAELRGYQVDGFRWMSRLAHWGAGACLADDMGLGKTVQAIALMLHRGKQGASLVIAPASVLLNWKSEIERFAPSLTSLVMHDADGGRKELVNGASDFDIVLTTYGLLIKESELLASRQWNVILLDEAHTIKNKETKMSKAAMELKADFRLMLTGTPVQNHLGEIWNLFQFANPGLLGTFPHFNENFILPIERDGNKQRQKQLKKMLSPFLLRRTKAEVLDELPEKTEIVLQVELSVQERALYENLRQQAVLNIEENSGTAMQTLAEITRLRQAACHPALVNKGLTIGSSKTEAFLKLTDELMGNNHRALVFSQFTSHLALIRKELDERCIDYLYLDGSVSVNERAALVRAFQTGEQPLFLISLKAGGTGLNLTAADYVIHLDPWWNPAVEDQASDRVYRIGQTRPVTIYRLIASQTIEEKIIKLHQTKKSLADALLDGSDMAHKLTKEEMLELLRGGIL